MLIRNFLTIVAIFIFSPQIFGQQEVRPLELNKPIERELKGGENHVYQFTLAERQFLHVVAMQRGVDVVVSLFTPEGKKVLEVDSPNGNRGEELLWFISDAAGDYRIEIASLEKEVPAGKYEVAIKELRPAGADDEFLIAGKKAIAEGVSFQTENKEESTTKAIERFNAAESFFRRMSDKKERANAVQQLGRVYGSLNKLPEATRSFIEAAKLFQEAGANRDATLALMNAGKSSPSQIEAINNFRSAQDSTKIVGDTKLEVSALIEIGNAYYGLGDFSQALAYYDQALKISQKNDYQDKIASTLDNMGSAYTAQNNFLKALEAHQKSLALTESLGNTRQIPGTLLNIGNIYEGQNSHAQALEHFQKALTEFEKMRAPVGIAYATSNIGSVYLNSGEYEKALEYLQKAQQLKAKFLPKDPYSFVNIGLVYAYQEKYTQALEHFEKARILSEEMGDTNTLADTMGKIADVYQRQGEYSKSLDYAGKTIRLSEQFDYPNLSANARTVAAKAYLGLGKKKEAKESLEASIAGIEKLRAQVAGSENEHTGFFENKIEPFQLMVELLASENRAAEALAYAERAKSRSLLDILQSGKIDFSKALTQTERAREKSLRNEIAALNNQINGLQAADKDRLANLQNQLEKKRLEFEDFQTRLYAVHPALRIERGAMQPVSLEEAAKLLPDEKTALLEYVVSGEKTFLFVITKDRPSSAPTLKVYPVEIKQTDLAKRTESFRSKAAAGDLDFSRAARDLYDLLVKPAAAQIGDKTHLIIVPDAALWDLPFQALQLAPNKYLIENAAVSYAPSLTALREIVKKKNKRPVSDSLLAFGNPSVGKDTSNRITQLFMNERLADLPEAERLVNSLKQMYGASKSRIYTGAEAREEIAKTESPQYKIVQFAAHGILNNVNPMYSHLVLAQKADNANEDGLLEAWEMKNLQLNADLVILSGCETARGQFDSGEGVVGMSWALFIAGAPTTVASQWKVESKSTTELMLEFHRQLLSGKGISKAEALRRASLKLLKMPQYKHPSYWAGFVMVGDGF